MTKITDSFAIINASGFAVARTVGDMAEKCGAETALLYHVASQVRVFREQDLMFDAVTFIRSSGIEPDWLIDRVLTWSRS